MMHVLPLNTARKQQLQDIVLGLRATFVRALSLSMCFFIMQSNCWICCAICTVLVCS
jgi:hypothetical protein